MIDFTSDKVFLNSSIPCSFYNKCELDTSFVEGPELYQGKTYYYKTGRAFLGTRTLLSDYYFIEDENEQYKLKNIRYLMKNSEFNENVLGLSPQSLVWDFWSRIYNFDNKTVTFTYKNVKNEGQIIFYNINVLSNNTGIRISRNS